MIPADLAGWLAHIERLHPKTIEMGLERVARVRDAMRLAIACPVIIVGGTNGKGSTCAMLEAILLAAGYRVGTYTSPHLLRYNERVRVDGREATDAVLNAGFAAVEAARGDTALTYFEFGTLAAMATFAAAQPDVLVLEVGLGGRLDAVNAFTPDCSILTSVDMDHMDYLGDTREKIGWEKAHIFRGGRPAICGDPLPPATVNEVAQAMGADLQLVGRDFGYEGDRQQWRYWGRAGTRAGLAYPALRGANQLLNASSVIAALDALRERLPVSNQAIRQGFALVELPGRFQVLPGRPAVILDVAHNPHAAAVLAENLSSMGFFTATHAVFAMLRDKDIAGVCARLKGRVDHWHVAPLPGNPRGAAAEQVAGAIRDAEAGGEIALYPTVADAYAAAREQAEEGDRIVVFGSFHTVAEVMAVRGGERK
jgi:dihydrofolate synthase/folylpolyglutamate synthase